MRKKTSKKTARATFGRGQGRATRGLFRRCRALRLSALPRYALVFRASVHPRSRGAATFQCVGRPERRDARTDSGHERRLHQRRQRVRSAAPHRGAGIDQSHHADPRQRALSKMSYTPTHWRVGKKLAFGARLDSDGRMIRGGFLSEEDRKALIALARDGLAAGRVTRRATALVRLDEGLSCQEVAKVLLFDDDTIRDWYELFEQDGVEGLTRFEMGGSSGKISAEQCDALKAWVGSTLPRSTRQVGAWIAKEFGLVYESRSGLIALLHRLRLEYHKPEVISRKLDPKTQQAFIASYENLMNSMGDDEVVARQSGWEGGDDQE